MLLALDFKQLTIPALTLGWWCDMLFFSTSTSRNASQLESSFSIVNWKLGLKEFRWLRRPLDIGHRAQKSQKLPFLGFIGVDVTVKEFHVDVRYHG